MEPAFDHLPGVASTTVGYTGGKTEHPTYEEVCERDTGHAESIEIIFDPKKIGYRQLLDVFWHNVDPTTRDRQFCDYGRQYRTAIFFHDPGQQRDALESKAEIENNRKLKVVTEIVPAAPFWPAEDHHQKYYLKNPIRYRLYKYNCGRDERLKEVWGGESGGH